MLYFVATPIGNLEDITLRALKILKEADLILCEDTRVTKKLLDHYEMQIPTLSYHHHTPQKKVKYIIDLLRQGKKLALVSDSGTPGLADPGDRLVKEILKDKEYNRHDQRWAIIPIPGPSALTALISISGFLANRFLFLGYPPHKKGRVKFFKEVLNSPYPVIFYESPHRILKSLEELKGIMGEQERQLVVGRELTKMYETVYRGNIDGVMEEVSKDLIKGEFVVLINSKCKL